TLAMLRFAFGLGLGLDHSFRQAMKAHKAMRGYREKSGNHYLNRKVTTDFFLHQELCPSQTTCRISRPSRKTGSRYLWPLERGLCIKSGFTHRRQKFWRGNSAVS